MSIIDVAKAISMLLSTAVGALGIRFKIKSTLPYRHEIEHDKDLKALSKRLRELQRPGEASKIDEQRRENLDGLAKRVQSHEFERKRDLRQLYIIIFVLILILCATAISYFHDGDFGSLLYMIFIIIVLVVTLLTAITLDFPFLTRVAAKYSDYFRRFVR